MAAGSRRIEKVVSVVNEKSSVRQSQYNTPHRRYPAIRPISLLEVCTCKLGPFVGAIRSTPLPCPRYCLPFNDHERLDMVEPLAREPKMTRKGGSVLRQQGSKRNLAAIVKPHKDLRGEIGLRQYQLPRAAIDEHRQNAG